VVIKSLALPKLNHLILSLPNPSEETIKKLQNLCYSFLWNNGRDVFDSYILFDEKITIKKDNCLTLPLWHTRCFRIAGNSVFYKHFYEGGILFVNDLLNENCYFHSFDSFIQK